MSREVLKDVKFEVPSDLEPNRNESKKLHSDIYEFLESGVLAIILLTVLYVFIFCQVSVKGDSMTDTLQNNDRLIIWRWGYTPKNNDIVVINKEQYIDDIIIKRVIATEGQSLNIDYSSGEGVITVDGVTLDEPYIKEPTLPNSIYNNPEGEIPSVVPEGYCFVMGDNRNGSTDSRSKIIGLIRNENVVGKAVCRVYPFNKMGYIG